jgi:hypothetical protein
MDHCFFLKEKKILKRSITNIEIYQNNYLNEGIPSHAFLANQIHLSSLRYSLCLEKIPWEI